MANLLSARRSSWVGSNPGADQIHARCPFPFRLATGRWRSLSPAQALRMARLSASASRKIRALLRYRDGEEEETSPMVPRVSFAIAGRASGEIHPSGRRRAAAA
jgi:hypothetical protein